jgi:hypothetical protein
MGAGTLEIIARQLSLVFEQLQAPLGSSNPGGLFSRLGITFPAATLAQASIANPLNTLRTAVNGLTAQRSVLEAAIAGGEAPSIIAAGAQLLAAAGMVSAALDSLANAIRSLSPTQAPGLTTGDLSAYSVSFSRRLFADLLISYMGTNVPTLSGVLQMTGVLDNYPDLGDPSNPAKPAYMVRDLHLDRLGAFLQSPANLLQTLYGWGNPRWDAPTFLGRISAFLGGLGFVSRIISPSAGQYALQSLFIDIQPDTSVTPEGLTATLHASVEDGYTTSLAPGPNWTVDVAAHGGIDAETGLKLAPPAKVFFVPPSGTLSGDVIATLSYTGGIPTTLIGVAGGNRLDIASCNVGCGINLTWDAGNSWASATWALQGSISGQLVIDMLEADGFLSSVTGGNPIEADFDFRAEWHPDTGLHIDGGGQFELTLPLNLNLGPVTLPTLYLVAGADSSGLPLQLAVDLGVTLGPIQGNVDHVGLQALLSFPTQGGNLGPANFSIGFKPPNGLGLLVDMGLVTGGGYISFDQSKGQYSGVLDLSIVDIVTVKVIGVLDTHLPDGSTGYSFLLIITFDLPPTQLGFGFTLTGVGGLGGVNRTMVQDALRTGLRAHTLDNILFPPNPIANAPQIISDIESFFPPQQGRYLFGPIMSIGWGTPTLLDFEVGVILEVPDPVRLAILGEINVAIPDPDVALIQIHIDVLGLIDFGLEKLSIDGTTFDSYLLTFQLAGDMALRFNWGDNANFLVSFGGFNPHFLPPPGIPQLQRLSVSLGVGDNPRLSSNSYFAVTSNSLQFGANVDAYAAAGGFAVHGYIGFDTLFIFSPFSFEIDFSAGFDISYEGASLAGIQLDASLSGPRPFHLHGDASFHILFFDVSASIDLTWGDSTAATLPSAPVLPPLLAALGNSGNWSTALPPASAQAVSLRTITPAPGSLVAHPMGTLTVRETVVPLDITITQFNGAKPSDGTEFQITAVTLNTTAAVYAPHQEEFAIAQFTTLSDADKLSAPSYEPFDAGVTIGAQPIINGDDSARTVVYEERYIDDYNQISRFGSFYSMPSNVHAVLVNSGAGATGPVINTGLKKFTTPGMTSSISIGHSLYVVASTTDLSPRTDILATGTTRYEALTAMQAHLALHPEEREAVQVLPVYEMAA